MDNGNSVHKGYESFDELLFNSRACSCPYNLCLCNVTVIYDYPCPINDIDVNINDSLKYKNTQVSEFSPDVAQEYSGDCMQLKLHGGSADELFYITGSKNSRFMVSDSLTKVDISVGDTFWFTNISHTCNTGAR